MTKIEAFGLKVRKLRLERGISQAYLVELIGGICGRTTIKRIEIGVQSVQLKTALKIAEVLHISLDDLEGE